jgi:hypothetical protein
MAEQLTIEEFGKRIKAKYPQYASLSDADIANKVLAKYPQYRAQVKGLTAEHGDIRPLTQRERFETTYPVGRPGESLGEDLHNTAQNVGVGIWQTIAHPIDTVTGIVSSVIPGTDTPNPVKAAYDMANTKDAEAAAQSAGQAIALAPVAELAGPMTRSLVDKVKSAREGSLRFATKTGPRETAKVVEDTANKNATIAEKNAARKAVVDEKNSAAATKHSEDVRKQAEKRDQDLQQHFEKTQKVREQNAAKQAAADRKVALERGVEHLDPELKTQLEATEKDIHAKANAKYEDLRKTLGKEEVPAYQAIGEDGHIAGEPEAYLRHIFDNAASKITDWSNDPTLLRSIGDRLKMGDVQVTWSDLQDLRTKVGAELRKGTLPADHYLAYKSMMNDVDQGMQSVADAKGLGAAQLDARNYYRRFAETFWDRTSPIRKALDSTERGGVVKAFRGKDQSGVEALAQFNPELAQRVNTVRGFAGEAAGIRPSPTRAAEPALAPKPAPIPEPVPKVAKVTPGEVLTPEKLSDAKKERAVATADRIRNSSNHLATVFVTLDAIRRVIHGDLGGLAIDATARVGYAAGKNMFANFLQSPKVIDAVGKITPADVKEVMKLPADQRAGFDTLLIQAQAQGAKLRPGVLAAVSGVAAPSIVGDRTRHLKKLRDEYQYTER